MPEIDQPFDVTKAVDFTDAQIAATWVDLPEGGFFQLVAPRSPMPLMLLGGKGSGRTHLMRYYSYSLQKIRSTGGDLVGFLQKEGYVGIYMRCEGLNAGRFDGKGQSAEAWAMIFAYYMDLWLAQLVIQTLGDAFHGHEQLVKSEAALVGEVSSLFDEEVPIGERTLEGLIASFTGLRREVDRAVNNAALTRSLGDLRIRSTRGRLVFGMPKLFVKHLPALSGVQIAYLIDELENLTESQQQYVNTLIREKEPPCTFKVGSRLYGFRTQQTLSAGEENRLGSEYEQVLLDEQLRVHPQYDAFARQLVARRLQRAGYFVGSYDPSTQTPQKERLESLFETMPASEFEREQTKFVAENYKNPEERPWLVKLRKQLLQSVKRRDTVGVGAEADVVRIVNSVSCAEYPLLEKLNIFLLYQDWSSGQNLLEAAGAIEDACRALQAGEDAERHKHVLSHFKGDLLAQLLRETRQKQRYLGLQTFIDMSSGLPRHLLIVLKFVHRWALFQGERPFTDTPISIGAQRAGVLQASSWFFEDARATGSDAERVQASVERLARFFHQLRYSDKPVESALTTFSFGDAAVSEQARKMIRQAHDSSLLLRVISGAKDRNDEGVVAKYQINPMLCPRFDLPLSRRGTVALSVEEVEAIFGIEPDSFDAVLRERLARMNAPFRRRPRGKGGSSPAGGTQNVLPGLE
jgi:hypothetical protein